MADHVLDRLAEDLGAARAAVHPALRARYLAQIQWHSGWALRQAVTECRERLGMTWRDTASSLRVPYPTLYRQYTAGGRLVVGEAPAEAPAGTPAEEPDRKPAGPELLILGEMIVRADGRNVALPGPSVRGLLGALLLFPGDIVGEDRLLELAWGERGTRRALQCAVHRLRSWLRRLAGQPCRLEHSGSGYRLMVPAESVDLARFRARVRAGASGDPDRRLALLSAALGEWRGPVLGGRPEWLADDPVVRAVEQSRVDTAATLADLALRLGRSADVVSLVAEVAAAAPYDEPLQARLVRLLSASGRHAEALRQVERVRERLADDLGIGPSEEMRSAHAAALQEDSRFVPIPMQLPPDVPDFTGRHREIETICDPMLAGRGPLVFAVSGGPGLGKTALTVHVAHRMAALYSNGQLHADLRGSDPYVVLGRFLHALGVDEQVLPWSLDERVALYRSRTAGRRVLVLLDDAADEAQVRPLVPGAAGCAVLVTGRTWLAGLAGARLLKLGVPAQDEAVRLLCRVSGRPGLAADPAAAEIVRLCDRVPLAVRIAGARLAMRPRLSAAGLAGRLRDPDRRLDELAVHGLSMRASLDSAYRDLAVAHRETFRQLGALPATGFPARSAGALLGVSAESATAHLEALADAGLADVVGDEARGEVHYALTDLMRIYALERARHGVSG
ncbi:AfsR/SARP family transcriptional regulator [Actinomadura rudentiformis]|nr:BTAD domain-containing putative transcriptional regulator [Actinomadura rudentiformis]